MGVLIARLMAMAWACLLVGACAGQTDGSASPSPGSSAVASHVGIPGAGDALLWGSGAYGVVLLHESASDAASWSAQATAMARDRMTAVALESVSADGLRAAIEWLRTDRKVARVAVLAAGGAARSLAELADSAPTLIDQAIVISPPAGLDWSAEFPKLFAASAGEPAASAARAATDQAAGTWNVLFTVDGSASGQGIFGSPTGNQLVTVILRRLDERR
jgi:hypothetical protein